MFAGDVLSADLLECKDLQVQNVVHVPVAPAELSTVFIFLYFKLNTCVTSLVEL